jgi:hypothetical protein
MDRVNRAGMFALQRSLLLEHSEKSCGSQQKAQRKRCPALECSMSLHGSGPTDQPSHRL